MGGEGLVVSGDGGGRRAAGEDDRRVAGEDFGPMMSLGEQEARESAFV